MSEIPTSRGNLYNRRISSIPFINTNAFINIESRNLTYTHQNNSLQGTCSKRTKTKKDSSNWQGEGSQLGVSAFNPQTRGRTWTTLPMISRSSELGYHGGGTGSKGTLLSFCRGRVSAPALAPVGPSGRSCVRCGESRGMKFARPISAVGFALFPATNGRMHAWCLGESVFYSVAHPSVTTLWLSRVSPPCSNPSSRTLYSPVCNPSSRFGVLGSAEMWHTLYKNAPKMSIITIAATSNAMRSSLKPASILASAVSNSDRCLRLY